MLRRHAVVQAGKKELPDVSVMPQMTRRWVGRRHVSPPYGHVLCVLLPSRS